MRPRSAPSSDAAPLSQKDWEAAFEPELAIVRYQAKCLASDLDWLAEHTARHLPGYHQGRRRQAILRSIGLLSRVNDLISAVRWGYKP